MMPYVTADAETLTNRGKLVRRLVEPLLPSPSRIFVKSVGARKNAYILAVVRNNEPELATLNPEQPLVQTRVNSVLLNYHEILHSLPQANDYYLERAYMHCYLREEPRPRQILSLHCDPALAQGDVRFAYGRGPHLHLAGARPEVGRAHISLCLGDPDRGGSTLNDLMARFKAAVQMIADEIFPCWERAAKI
jgi:hypothetical protein